MLHHYTTINNLALILRGKKIRFNRLDNVDDLTESSHLPHRFKSYYFVSCWTKSDKENISLWHMYTQMKGVKISFPNNPFLLHHLRPNQFKDFTLKSELKFPIAASEMILTHSTGFKFIFIPYDNEFRPFDVKYCDDNEEKIKNSFSYSLNNDGTKSYRINNDAPAIVKNSIWSFQDECRFILKLLPSSIIDQFGKKHHAEELLEKLSVEQFFFDIPLDESMFNSIIVTLGPNSTEADRIIVELLLKEFTTDGKLVSSILTGKVISK